MYNLLISGREDAYEDGHWEIERDRFLIYTSETLKQRFQDLTPEKAEMLQKLPTLFTFEQASREDCPPVQLGRITLLDHTAHRLAIQFEFYPGMRVDYRQFHELQKKLGITKNWELNTTHWALKDIDILSTGLFEAKEPTPPLSDRVFVVHGHDGNLTKDVATFLEEVGLTPIVLHEQANQGQTIIEKFERCADVGFAVVLMTEDDAIENGMMRARQNVILELGYFIAKLGRHRVCALRKGRVETPSDIFGVAYTNASTPSWQTELRRELEAAGYELRSMPSGQREKTRA
ncbi:MAG: nucleotide-binding protein [Alphaproteobacteria bacterium]|nr:nucleotide-binding protein [Alphaproteobacteria bacterium]